jgi:hypothetical protein
MAQTVSVHGYLQVGEEAEVKYKSSGVDGSNGINRRREVRMYIVL